MKTNLKKTTLAAIIAGIFFIAANANAAIAVKPNISALSDTGKMSKMSSSKMSSKMSKKKKTDKMSASKMKPASDTGKM